MTTKSKTTKTTQTLSRVRKSETTNVVKNKPVKSTDLVDTIAGESAPQTQPLGVELPGLEQNVTGRGVFAVRTLGDAVSVEAAFLAEDGNVLRLPAVFPNRQYAMEQIDELRAIVNKHFDNLEATSARGQ